MKLSTPRIVLPFVLWCAALLAAAAEPAPRSRQLLDFGWKFHLGNEWGIAQNLAKSGTGYGPASLSFSDTSWRRVDLPHDWAVELPFDAKADVAHGFRALGPGFPENSTGWYRRTFDLPAAAADGRIWLEFDGVFRDTTVFVNGWAVGHHEGGYNGFRYDITDVANAGGKNLVAVRVDASQFEGWFYEGAGIYRHVWLVQTGPVALAPDGVFVYSSFKDNVPSGPAAIHLQARLNNSGKTPADTTVSWTITAPDGKTVAETKQAARVDGFAALDVVQTVQVGAPELWSRADRTIDRVETEFGIRTVAFDADKGFLLNGKPYLIKGTCNHQDHAGVGAALPDGLQYFRIMRLKEMGTNAYRTSHNPPTPELLEACDRLGMLVMDENRLLGSDAQNLARWEEQVLRDRNHPSVAIWSIGNEEFSTQRTPAGGRVAATMQDFVKRLDPTRPVTINSDTGNEFVGVNAAIEVRGWSYHIGVANMDAYHAAHPTQPNVGSEQGSTVSTRGIYADDKDRGYVSAYDDHAQAWSNTAEQWWSFFDPRPWLSGGFIWTGFDYRGEPTPYAWPCVNSHFGIFDTCGFAKDNFWYYKAWWSQEPVLHLLPHWNWAGREGGEMDVRALSNCDEVELFLNGRSLGRQTMPHDSELKWKVSYAPGTLSAKGFRGGQLVVETKVETTGAPAAVRLASDRLTVRADGEDVSILTVSVHDNQGRVVPTASNLITFELAGPGRILGVGNGDPSSHEADVFFSAPTVRTIPVDGWRWKKFADIETPNLPEEGVEFDDSTWAPVDANAASGPMGVMERGIFRTRFTVSAEDLAAPGVELWFGKIEGNGVIYVNGKSIGMGGDARAASVHDVKALLHPGENTVAVAIANWGAAAGLNNGVKLRLIADPVPVQWQRSVFNGLAQVIVRTTKESGAIKLTARAEGLTPATVTITADPATPRPSVP
jgi:beta-galactosidase